MQSRGPVIVVGGGIAGLMCARTLTRAGHDVALFERDSAIGGRVRTTVVDGFQLDTFIEGKYPVDGEVLGDSPSAESAYNFVGRLLSRLYRTSLA